MPFNCFLLEEIFEKGNISNDQIQRLVRQIKSSTHICRKGICMKNDFYEEVLKPLQEGKNVLCHHCGVGHFVPNNSEPPEKQTEYQCDVCGIRIHVLFRSPQ